MALRMSMQQQPSLPEPKRSKPWENAGAPADDSFVESPEAKNRRLQRELMAAAAEKRMVMLKDVKLDAGLASASKSERSGGSGAVAVAKEEEVKSSDVEEKKEEDLGEELSMAEANQLFSMVFGNTVSKDILAQWTNQGIRYAGLYFMWTK